MSETFPRVAIVTGATSGFGRATAEKFISSGFGVVGCGRNQSRLESMEKQSETRFAGVAGDASDESLIDRLFTTAADRFGRPAENDIADTIHYIVSQLPHVHLCDVVVRPTRMNYP
jgi:NADP-dependent 3-hydroxy acid dehydrogenase YdfG